MDDGIKSNNILEYLSTKEFIKIQKSKRIKILYLTDDVINKILKINTAIDYKDLYGCIITNNTETIIFYVGHEIAGNIHKIPKELLLKHINQNNKIENFQNCILIFIIFLIGLCIYYDRLFYKCLLFFLQIF